MTSNVELRSFEEDDFETLIHWVESPSFLLQWAGPVFSYPLDEAQLQDHLEPTNEPRPTRRAFKAVDTADETIGYLELNDLDRQNQSASVSRVIVSPDARGHGYGTTMMKRLLAIGFEDVGLHRIGLRVFDFNESAITCYENAGFTREGVLREARRHGDEYWTLIQMSILKHEWMSGS